MEPLRDTHGRPLETLRLSVTDRCNFRCVYCMPKSRYGRGHEFLERGQILTLEEIARAARAFAALGVRTVHITGGEPLVRRDVEHLVELLAEIPALELAMTTNGSLLAAKAEALARAGLHRVSVSLDALDDGVFRTVNDVDVPVRRVLEGIDAAAGAGLPVKVNAVVKRGLNDESVLPLAERFRGTGHVLRFIEYMDVGTANGWRLDDVVPADEIVRRIAAVWPLDPVVSRHPGETAERYRYRDGGGEIGVIASVTRPFCSDCSRVRLTADGRLFTCLFGAAGHDLRGALRGGASDDALAETISAVWQRRADRYSERRADATVPPRRAEMSYIGG